MSRRKLRADGAQPASPAFSFGLRRISWARLFQIDRDSFHCTIQEVLLRVLHWFIQSNIPGFSTRLVIEIHDDVIQRVLVQFALFVRPEAHAKDADLVILED